MGTTPITTARQKVRVIHKEIPEIDWHKVSEQAITHNTTLFRPTGMGKKIPLDGDSSVENMTTEAALRMPEMAGFLADLKAGKKFPGTVLVVSYYDVDGVETGKTEWFNCMVAKPTWPATDSNNENADVANVMVEWAVGDQS